MENKKPHNITIPDNQIVSNCIQTQFDNGILPTETDSATCAKCEEMRNKMKQQNIESNKNFTIKCFGCIQLSLLENK